MRETNILESELWTFEQTMDFRALRMCQKDPYKTFLPEIELLRGKVKDKELEVIKDVLDRNQDLFSRHKADIGCCNLVEHEIELEESAVTHRGGGGGEAYDPKQI